MALKHFLIVYNIREGRLVDFMEFGTNRRSATDAYGAMELTFRDREDHADYEIVLVGADSEDTLRVTHSRYFEHDRDLVPFS